MKNSPLISVIMNCYNGDKFLKEAIESVISQTYECWEIIFWDNQSTDNSASIINSYSDERISYYYADNHSPLGEARNEAISKAKGEWIGILDCDDIWNKNKLEKQILKVREGVGIIYSRTEFLVENNCSPNNMLKTMKSNIYPKRKVLPSGKVLDELLFDCFIPLPSVLIQTKKFLQVGGIDSTLEVAEDYDIFLKIASISEIVAIDEVLCKYRIHSNNLSHSNVDTTFEESIFLVEKYANLFNVTQHITFWKMKFIKHMLMKSNLVKAVLISITLNPLIAVKLIVGKYYDK